MFFIVFIFIFIQPNRTVELEIKSLGYNIWIENEMKLREEKNKNSYYNFWWNFIISKQWQKKQHNEYERMKIQWYFYC